MLICVLMPPVLALHRCVLKGVTTLNGGLLGQFSVTGKFCLFSFSSEFLAIKKPRTREVEYFT